MASIFKGTQGADTLNGTDDADTLYGYGSNDILNGMDDDDLIYGGDGNDQLYGGDGDDKLYGEAGNDELEGGDGDGDDKLYGGAGNDKLYGGYGDDVIYGGAGNDVLQSGGGSNSLYGEDGDDVLATGGAGAWLSTTKLYGGAGNDYYSITRVSDSLLVDDAVPQVIEYANQGIDTIGLGSSFFNEMSSYQMPDNVENLLALRSPAASLSGKPDETMEIHGNGLNNDITGTPEDDALYGGDGNDTLRTRALDAVGTARIDNGLGSDHIEGGAGNDTLIEVGSDVATLLGGSGDDSYYLSDRGYYGSEIGFMAGWSVGEQAGEGHDTIYTKTASSFLPDHVEDLIYMGADQATTMHGNAGDNYIRGGHWNADTIYGYGGDDVLDGGQYDFADTLYGGNGNDKLYGNDGNDKLYGENGDDQIYGGNGNDLATGGSGDDKLFGQAGDDNLYGEQGADTLFGDVGNDTLWGGAGADSLSGGDGNDYLSGDADNDYLHGGNGDDTLVDGDGADTLNGWYGNDTLISGWGADVLTGGGGADKFRFNAVLDSTTITGVDKVMDFQQGQDKIDLSAIDANVWVAGNQAFNFIGQQPFQPGFLPGQLIQKFVNGNTVLQADYDGNATVDFELVVVGLVTFTTADFVL